MAPGLVKQGVRDYFSARGWRVDLPELDLPPGDYRERKPKGWRWKLPWAHPEDTKMPAALFVAAFAFAIYFLLNLPLSWIAVALALMAFLAGALFMWAFGGG